MMLNLMIATRVIVNPVSNAIQKSIALRGVSPWGLLVATHALLSLGALPLLAFALAWPPVAFWWPMGWSALLCVAGNGLLLFSLRDSDLSVLGAVSAYKPLVALLPGALLLHEFPPLAGYGGIGLIVAGSSLLGRTVGDSVGASSMATSSGLAAWLSNAGVRFRLAALVCSGTEAVFLKQAVAVTSPLVTLAWWSVLGAAGGSVVWWLVERRRWRADLQGCGNTVGRLITLAFSTGLMQGCTLFTLAEMPVGYSLALFQTSALLQVWFGHRYFREPRIAERLLATLVMVAGAGLLIVSQAQS